MEPDGYVYYEMRKGMYRLKQAARLVFDNIVKLLAPHGYFHVQEYPGVWKHKTLTTVFTLCVDNFGTKANYMEEMHHLINAIKKYFKCSINWEGQNYLGLAFDWNYTKKFVDISMPGYIPTVLHKFQHKRPESPQDASHPWNKSVYGKHTQLATHQSSAPKLNSADTNRVQSVNGTFIYYAQEVDPTILPSLNKIST